MPNTSAADVLRLEASALSAAADRVDALEMERAVALLATSSTKVILTGAGTAGLVARKIAATFTSTGTPAIFLHPADALHGGLGLVSEGDVVIAVSNSGETDEVLVLLPYLRVRGVSIIAVVGNLTSSLAKQADVVLDAAASAEACPLNLAPTSTAVVAMALGDALAAELMQHKGITAEVFARSHPSGRLGRRLTLRVADLMHSRSAMSAVPQGATFLDAIGAITKDGLGAVCVLDVDQLVGIVTDGDVRRAVAGNGGAVLGVTVRDVMTARPVTVASTDMAYDALRVMEERPSQISVAPVVDNGMLVGMIRLHDLVRMGL